jgi:hypothetical protein
MFASLASPDHDRRRRRGRGGCRALAVLLVVLPAWALPRGAAELRLSLAVNAETFAPGSSLTLMLTVQAPAAPTRGDLYLAALTPDQRLVFLGPGLRPSARPLAYEAGRALAPGVETLGTIVLGSRSREARTGYSPCWSGPAPTRWSPAMP